MPSSAQVTAAIILGIGTLLYLLYRSLLPKPIPGIPYDEASIHRLLGDIPDIVAWQKVHQEPFGSLVKKFKDLDSPIIQVFGRVGGRPWVAIADGREATDIMNRRSADFDRSKCFGDLVNAIMPRFHAKIMTNDEWRAHRRLLNDTMSPSFLYSTNANDHPIDAAAFGKPTGAVQTQIKNVAKFDKISPGPDGVFRIPNAEIPLEVNAVPLLAESMAITAKSPLGGLHHKFATLFYPSLRAAMKAKETLLRRQIDDAAQRIRSSDDAVQSATDFVVAREMKAAEKEGRPADIHSPVIHDELYGFLIAGHDTGATVSDWGVNYLMRNPKVQDTLRSSIQTAFPNPPDGVPTAKDIATTSLPYLDAFIDEALRLGHMAPTGTDVFMFVTSPAYRSKHATSINIPSSPRSRTSQDSYSQFSDFNPQDISEFKPERWLNDDGTYNPNAGPSLGFGAGLRGCFGKKLGLLELRMFFVLLVWNFEVLSPIGEQGPLLRKQTLALKPRTTNTRFRDLRE
ncbi:cytochrome P450 [Phaeosphaeriaceae sp. PMI808]|nr:cytochrome P450 [Phaeosphaeriaceae sp. PMI808]